MNIIDCIGKPVRFRWSFQTEDAWEEGLLVGYAERPQAIVKMKDGVRRYVDASLVTEVQDWVEIR